MGPRQGRGGGRVNTRKLGLQVIIFQNRVPQTACRSCHNPEVLVLVSIMDRLPIRFEQPLFRSRDLRYRTKLTIYEQLREIGNYVKAGILFLNESRVLATGTN